MHTRLGTSRGGGGSHTSGPQGMGKRVRAEARGGSGEGWHRRAIKAYTWCVTEKGPQRKWLHKIGKVDTPECHCHQEKVEEQSGRHTVEGCRLLVEVRGIVEKEAMREWETRHARVRKKKKEDVGTEKEKEKEEGEQLVSFFGAIYEFFNPDPFHLFLRLFLHLLFPLLLFPLFPLFPLVILSHLFLRRRHLLFHLYLRCFRHHHHRALVRLHSTTSIERPEASNTQAQS